MKKPKTEVVTGILSGLAMVGVAVTGVLTAMRAPKYKEILEDCEGSKPKAVFKTYWPAITAGIVTDICIGLSWGVNVKAIGTLTAAAGYLAANRDQILETAKKYVPEDKIKELKKEADKEMVKKAIPTKTAGPSVEETGRGDLLCYEGYSGRWFRSDEVAVNEGIKRFNSRWKSGEYLGLNDLYHEFGIARTHFGNQYGWANHMDYYDTKEIDITTELVSGWDGGVDGGEIDEDVLIIEIWHSPMECWMEV